MPKGGKPKPVGLRIIEGNRGKRPLPEEPDLYTGEMPEPPPFLNDDALEHWYANVELLFERGVVTKSDGTALATYCQLYGRWAQAERAFAEHQRDFEKRKAEAEAAGETLPVSSAYLAYTPNGASMQHPLIGAANTAARDLMRYAIELGLTPSARTKIRPEKTGKKANPAAKYLG